MLFLNVWRTLFVTPLITLLQISSDLYFGFPSRLQFLWTMVSSVSPLSTTPAELLGANMADHCLLSLSWWRFWYIVFYAFYVKLCKIITRSLSFLCRIRQFLWHNRRQYDVTRIWQRRQQQSARHPHGSRGEETPRRGVENRTCEGTKFISFNLRLIPSENMKATSQSDYFSLLFASSGSKGLKKLPFSHFVLLLLNELSLSDKRQHYSFPSTEIICVYYTIRSVIHQRERSHQIETDT